MASRTATVRMCLRQPDGTYVEPLVVRTISVSEVDCPLRYVVRGFGINEAGFESLDAIYALFGGTIPRIQLDYGGNKLLMECLEEMGFVRPTGYFV
jgi:hypothetical protein